MGLKGIAPGFADTFTAATKFLAADGTAALPSYSFTSNTGTGVWASTNAWVLSANGSAILWGDVSRLRVKSSTSISWSAGDPSVSAEDLNIARDGANSIRFGGNTGSAATTRTEINKAVTAFTNAAAKVTFTVTVPNAAHNATLEFRVQGALGAGGAIGAGEAMATNTYVIGIVRTAGVATVATATAAFGAVAVAVAGAATVTATAAVSAMSGAVGATQTFTLDVTISRSGGSSDNHTALVYGKLLNANATGITIA